jgi:hypothetical protein
LTTKETKIRHFSLYLSNKSTPVIKESYFCDVTQKILQDNGGRGRRRTRGSSGRRQRQGQQQEDVRGEDLPEKDPARAHLAPSGHVHWERPAGYREDVGLGRRDGDHRVQGDHICSRLVQNF